MKRNTLYTVSRGNKHAIIGNLYDGGGWFGIEKKDNPFSKMNFGNISKMAGTSIGGGILNGISGTVGSFANKAISGGLSSGAGSAISGVGGTVGGIVGKANPLLGAAITVGSGVVGGVVNSLVGTSTDQKKLADANSGTAAYNNFTSNASTFDEIEGPVAQANVQNAFRGGLFKKGWASRKNADLRQQRIDARQFADRSILNNVYNLADDQLNDAMANYAAYGGLLDTANEFAKGGSIHIKHPGRLTALKKRTGKTEAELYNDGNPAHKKMVVFARNARKWKKAYGGFLDDNEFSFGGGMFPFSTPSGALDIMQGDKYIDAINNRSSALVGKNFSLDNTIPQTNVLAAGGDLASTFFNNFSSDPIGAAIRYRQDIERREEERAAAEEAAERSAEYAAMQQRLNTLETRNQGLEAMLNAIPTTVPTMPATVPEPESPSPVLSSPSSEAPSIASSKTKGGKGNKTWNYIEKELRNSGKFNDIQIAGIKANLERESAMNYDIIGDGGAAYGLGQWHGSRQPKDKSLAGQTKYIIDTMGTMDRNHWIGENNYKGFLNARTPEEAHYYLAAGYERPKKEIQQRLKRESDMSLQKIHAFGGELGTNGTDFTNGLLQVNEGSTHEDNPLGGVPLGVDEEGIPNMVEEGETVYNNYVFSNRLNVPDFMHKELGLGGTLKKDMTFAKASKILARESEQRPNDPISQDGLDAALAKLAEVQEAERVRQRAKEYAEQNEYALGGDKGKKKIYKTSNFNYNTPTLTGDKKEETPDKKAQVDALFSDSTPAPTPTSNPAPSPATPVDPPAPAAPITFTDDPFTVGTPTYPWTLDGTETPVTTEPALSPLEQIARDKSTPTRRVSVTDNGTNLDVTDTTPATEWIGGEPEYEEGTRKEDRPLYPTWMRYAPVFGAGIMSLTDALGLTNRPDYTYARQLEAVANRAGYSPDVRYRPIGNYLRYNPMDIWYEQNRLNANSRATDRALMNTSGGNRGTAAAGMLANGYNSQLASGNLYRQALEYNDAKRQQVADFNRKTNMFNSQMGLEAAMANARYQQQARQFQLSGLAQAAALRDSIDQRLGAARAANLSNFLTSLGNIGRENFAMNQINWDPSRVYRGRMDGTSYYDTPEDAEEGAKSRKKR